MRDSHPVARDADEADEPLVPRSHQRLDCAIRAMSDIPLVFLDEVVELDEVDVLDVHALQRAFELGASAVAATLTGLRGEEDTVPVRGEPRPQAVLRGAVAGGGVDVVDAELGDLLQRGVGPALAHAAEGGSPENDPRRLVPGAPERTTRQGEAHDATVPRELSVAIGRIESIVTDRTRSVRRRVGAVRRDVDGDGDG